MGDPRGLLSYSYSEEIEVCYLWFYLQVAITIQILKGLNFNNTHFPIELIQREIGKLF